MIEGPAKREQKKDICHSAIVLEVLFQKWFPLEGAESQEEKKHAFIHVDRQSIDALLVPSIFLAWDLDAQGLFKLTM
jgi:hypothetical protein